MNSPMKRKIDYRIYPSLLDKFQELLDYQTAFEGPWNKVSETAKKEGKYPDLEVGDYILTADEMQDKLEQELVDAINRVPHEPWEAADKGTAFNEVTRCPSSPQRTSCRTPRQTRTRSHHTTHGSLLSRGLSACLRFGTDDGKSDSLSLH